ncbi:hypothetical protein GCM10007298_03910 [Williamsia phyllosphaerae]|uniref:Undecaprenyldiphospho-muramoylpentapeptide beta-N-acetylglucosaminyltransferase n=1 Tax=Williamsia phyllosphaerae TaxID=885042 RepID=A0ABQ1U5X3_9NOCA|nr:hypothetical protein GCM10007298_03910 [Williamsia phyllosphaerae]
MARDADMGFRAVPAAGLRRYFSMKSGLMPFVVIHGIVRAVVLLRHDSPRVVFSKGSFVSVPVVCAAWLLRIPIVIHESDHSMGLANRFAGRLAARVLLSHPDTQMPRSFRRRSRVVGEIVRPDLADGDAERFRDAHDIAADRPVVLVYGGGGGSGRINAAVRRGLDRLLEQATVVHVFGPGNIEQDLVGRRGYHQFDFIAAGMTDALRLADIVVARAGANTVAELAALGRHAILVPLPVSVSRGDQIVNARHFVERNGGVVLRDQDVGESLCSLIMIELRKGRERGRPTTVPDQAITPCQAVARMILEFGGDAHV